MGTTSGRGCDGSFTGSAQEHSDVAFSYCKGLWKEGNSMAILDWSQCPAVESVPGKLSGAWVLKGTRMPVSAIFENIEAGANIDDILEWFDGLDREQVKAVIEFAARSLDQPPVYAP